MYQFSESQTKAPWSAIILKIVIFIRICMVNGQGLPVQLICHTKPYNNRNFQIDGASQYFGVWVWQLVHLLILVCSFQWCVLFLCLAKLYRSCPIRDKGLFSVTVLYFVHSLRIHVVGTQRARTIIVLATPTKHNKNWPAKTAASHRAKWKHTKSNFQSPE